MVAEKFEILERASKGSDLLNRARRALSEAPTEQVQSLAEGVPTEITPADKKVKVVFAGQYSAGKSTILRVLTAREDIAIGAAITTQQTCTYEWEGLDVVDTPGVHTEIRPKHDEITYQAIADADLLVFVVTNELFDSHLAEHFRKLAIERDKAYEMMLVINKMRRSATGNSPEAQHAIREDLRKVLKPFSPEQLRISFIDAEAALESRTEKDEAIAEVLRNKSGFGVFVDALNSFVRDKKLTGRYTTALYSLEQVLQEALAAESLGDDRETDALEALLLQRRKILLETQQGIPRAVAAQVSGTAAQVREAGRKVSELLYGDVDTEQINLELEAAQQQIQEYTTALNGEVQNTVVEHIKYMDDRAGEIADSELARELLPRLAVLFQDQVPLVDISPEMMVKLKGASVISKEFGKFLAKTSVDTKAITLSREFSKSVGVSHKLPQYANTAAAQRVKDVGAFFGKDVSAVKAAKLSRGINVLGRVVAVGGVALSLYLDYKEEQDAAQREGALRESRSAVRERFNDAAHTIETRYDETTNTYVASTLKCEIEAIDQHLKELRDTQQLHGQLFKNLSQLLEETRSMIHELHTA